MSNNPWYTLLDGNDSDTYSYSFVNDNMNNLYVSGYSNSKIITISGINYSRNSETDAGYIAKLDENGNALWFNWIDGTSSQAVYSVAVDSNNNVYLTGFSNSTSVIIKGTSYNKSDDLLAGFIIKFNQNGNIIWFKWLDGTNSDFGYLIEVDKNDNIYIVGVSNSKSINSNIEKTNNTGTAGFLIKLNTDGIISWFKWIDGVNYDDSYVVTTDSNNNIYISGNSNSNSIIINGKSYQRDNQTQSIYLAKFDTNGIILWCIWIAGDNKDEVTSIACDNYNYIYLSGISNSKNITINNIGYSRTNNKDLNTAFVVKINSNSNIDWFKWFQGDQDVYSYAITTDNTNNLYMTGNTKSLYLKMDESQYINITKNDNAFLIKLTSKGIVEWIRWLFSDDKPDNNTDYNTNVYITNLFIDENYNLYVGGVSNAKNIYFNGENIFSKNTKSDTTLIFKYNLNDISLSEGIKSITYISNDKYIIYKVLFFSLLFIVYVYIIWLLYSNKII